MADSKVTPQAAAGSTCFKEAVCIDAGRIYDSCSDKDCVDGLPVYFSDLVQPVIDQSTSVKCKKVEIINVLIDVESVPFNKGFYAVDMTFFFNVQLDAYTTPLAPPVSCEGISIFNKKVILYGSEGGVKVFSSTDPRGEYAPSAPATYMPKASVQCVDPMCLNCKLVDARCECTPIIAIPLSVRNRYEGEFIGVVPLKRVIITLGLFSIVKLEREVQMLIPAYDFCVPDKECVSTADDPCELFKRVKFPTDEFFPPRLTDLPEE